VNFNMEVKIRKVKAGDWPVMKKTMEDIWKYHRPLFRKIDSSFEAFARSTPKKKFIKWTRQRNSYFILAESSKKPIGYLLARVDKDPANPKISFGKLTQIFVIPRYRGKGVSDLLWQDVLKWFKSRRVDFLQLYVTVNNKHAIEVYKKWGFKPYMIRMVKKF